MRSVTVLAALSAAASAQLQSGIYTHCPDSINGPEILTSNLVCDPSASPAERAAAIVAVMNITEKLANLLDVSNGSARLGLPPYESTTMANNGVLESSTGNPSAYLLLSPTQARVIANNTWWWSEALHGVAGSPGVNFSDSGEYSYATSFPVPILFSAAFDDQLVEDIATVISTESRAYSNAERGGLDWFTPNVNPYKDPRWGRGSETPGEDPLRIQGYVKRLLTGLEGTDGGYFNASGSGFKKMIATCKHFAGYDLEDWNGYIRYGYDAKITTQDLAEYYMPPFQTCSRDQNVGSIMCSYNAINGVPACANSYTMQTILREHWGWTIDNNYVTSDCNAIWDIFANHNYTTSSAAAEGVSLIAGMDNACIVANTFVTDQIGAYYDGYVNESVIDRSLRRQFEALVIAGYFDPAASNPYRSIGWDQVNTAQAQSLARQAATESITLLKNDGMLPYSFAKGQKVAMVGMWANGTTQMQGGYLGPAPYLHSPLYAAQQLGLDCAYANGPLNDSTLFSNYSGPAMSAAEGADVILYFGGIDIVVESEANDRYQIAWLQSQVALMQQLAALGKPMAVVQMGTMLDATPILNNENISSLLWAGYPGQDGGPAAFDILTGAVAPAGRLPITMYPADYVNQVPMTNMSLRRGPNNPGRTYRWYNDAVLPYAFGMHYTTFDASFVSGAASPPSYPGHPHGPPGWSPPSWGPPGHGGWGGPPASYGGWRSQYGSQPGQSFNIQQLLSDCNAPHPDLCPFPSVSVSVKNTGKTTSDYSAVVFYNSTAGPTPYPIKTSATYGRLYAIAPGQTSIISLNVTIGALARRDGNGDLTMYPGDYEFLLDVPTQARMPFSLTGNAVKLEAWPQPPVEQTYSAAEPCPLYGPCPELGQPVE